MRPITTKNVLDELDGSTFHVLTTKDWHMTGLQSLEAFKDWATLQAEQFGLTVTKQQALAQERARHAKDTRQAQEATLSMHQKTLGQLSDAHWGRAILFLVAALIGLVAELTITWVTIPYMIELKRKSLEAILLSLSPAVSTLALDVVIYRLIESPWRAAHTTSREAGTEPGLLANRHMRRFLLLTASVVLLMFVTLGLGRMEGAHWQDLLQQGTAESLQTTRPVAVDLAIVGVSVGVLLTTGLFLLLGMQEAHNCALHITTTRAVRRDEARVHQAREVEAEAIAEAARCDEKVARKTQLMACYAQLVYRLQVQELRSDQLAPQNEIGAKVKAVLNHLWVPGGVSAS